MTWYLVTIIAAVIVSLIPELIDLAKVLIAVVQRKLKNLLRPTRIAKAQRAWPQVIDDITSAVRSGISIEQALLAAATRPPIELRKLLLPAATKLRAGSTLSVVLTELQQAELDAVGKRLVISLQIASAAGGKDVVTTLQLLAESVRRDLALLDSLRANQKSAITGARVAVFAPWLVIALTSVQPSVRSSYQSSMGVALLIGVAIISLLAYWWMLQIAKLRIGALQ
jgi:tight adherence protein B